MEREKRMTATGTTKARNLERKTNGRRKRFEATTVLKALRSLQRSVGRRINSVALVRSQRD